MCFCTYRYGGFADPDEVAAASNIALQAYFEGRPITKEDMDACVEYWRRNISEQTDPIGRKREVCCEPFCVPIPSGSRMYRYTHFKRTIPYADEEDPRNTAEVRMVRHFPCTIQKWFL